MNQPKSPLWLPCWPDLALRGLDDRGLLPGLFCLCSPLFDAIGSEEVSTSGGGGGGGALALSEGGACTGLEDVSRFEFGRAVPPLDDDGTSGSDGRLVVVCAFCLMYPGVPAPAAESGRSDVCAPPSLGRWLRGLPSRALPGAGTGKAELLGTFLGVTSFDGGVPPGGARFLPPPAEDLVPPPLPVLPCREPAFSGAIQTPSAREGKARTHSFLAQM